MKHRLLNVFVLLFATSLPAWAFAQVDLAAPPSSQIETPEPAPSSDPKIDGLKAKIAKRPTDPKARVDLATSLDKRKDYAGVLEALKPVSDTLPRQGLLLLARAYGNTGDSMSEVRTLELALAKNPKDYYVKTALGEAYARARRREEAIASFREARELNPKYAPAAEGLLKELLAAKDLYESRTLLNDMLKKFGEKAEYLNQLCTLYTLDAYLEKAIETCEKAIRKNPKTPENYVNLGASLKDKEEEEKATTVLMDAAKKFPKSEAVQTAAGEIQARRKNHMAAFKLFTQALEVDAKSPKALIGYANSAFELQKYEEALGAYVRACTIDKKLAIEMRYAHNKLRTRKDLQWERRFESGLNRCSGGI